MNEINNAKNRLKTARQNNDAERWGVVVKDRISFEDHRQFFMMGWAYATAFLLALLAIIVQEVIKEVLK